MLSKPNHRTGRTFPALLALALGAMASGVTLLLPGTGYAAAPVQFASAPKLTLGDLVRAGKRESVLAAITSPDVDVNEQAPDGSTALMWATFNVDRELVKALLKRGAKADVINRYGASALGEAVKVDDIELVQMLLAAGANVNSPNLDGQTALMLAISIGSQPVAKLLIQRGADVNAVETFRNQNALMWAAGGNLPETVDLLLARGAKNVNLRAHSDDWPRQMTSEPRAQFGSRQTGGLTALLYATRSGCYRCVVSLLKAGADINLPNPDGVTPLINALDNRRYDIAMLLIEKGANVHTWDMSGRTPIYVAVDMNSFRGDGAFGGRVAPEGMAGAPVGKDRAPVSAMDVINKLLSMNVDVNHELTRKRPYGAGRSRFAEYDLRGGVSPLFVAAIRHDHVAMQALLAHGAEVDLANVFRMTPLMVANGMSGAGRTNGGGALAAGDVQTMSLKTIDLLLDAGADINARVTESRTYTAKLNSYVQGRDQEGRTALMAAVENNRDRAVKRLLERGADVSVKDATGKTALDIARVPVAAGPGGAAPPPAVVAARAAIVAALEARK